MVPHPQNINHIRFLWLKNGGAMVLILWVSIFAANYIQLFGINHWLRFISNYLSSIISLSL
jgi:hypothetical protein